MLIGGTLTTRQLVARAGVEIADWQGGQSGGTRTRPAACPPSFTRCTMVGTARTARLCPPYDLLYITGVMHGLDPRIHLKNDFLRRGWMTGAVLVLQGF